MKKLLNYADEFLKESTWKDLILIKCCVWAVGIMWGMAIPRKRHKPVVFTVVLVFVATCIPLMLKLFRIIDNNTSRK